MFLFRDHFWSTSGNTQPCLWIMRAKSLRDDSRTIKAIERESCFLSDLPTFNSAWSYASRWNLSQVTSHALFILFLWTGISSQRMCWFLKTIWNSVTSAHADLFTQNTHLRNISRLAGTDHLNVYLPKECKWKDNLETKRRFFFSYGWKMDIWAAGCVMYEVATLRPLFPGANELDQVISFEEQHF